MALSAAEFLDIVEREHSIAPAVLTLLRQQVAAAQRPVGAAVVAKYLVDKKHLPAETVRQILAAPRRPQASPPQPGAELIEALPASASPAGPRLTAEQVRSHLAPPEQRATAAAPARPQAEEDELGLAPDDDDPPVRSPAPAKPQPLPNQPAAPARPAAAQAFTADDLGLAPDEDEAPRARPTAAPVKVVPVRAVPVTAVPVQAAPVKAVPVKAVPVQAVPANVVPGKPVPAARAPDQGAPVQALPVATPPVQPATNKVRSANVATAGPQAPAGRVARPAQAPSKTAPQQRGQGPGNPAARPTGLAKAPAQPVAPQPGGIEAFDDLDDVLGLSPSGTGGGLTGVGELGDMVSDDPLLGGEVLTVSTRRSSRGLTRRQQQLIVGGSAAGVVLVLAVALAIVSAKGNGEAEFGAAEKDYQAQANQAAVAKFEDFLERFRRQPRTAVARVHLAMARLRLATANQHDWPAVLSQLPGMLDGVVGQEESRDCQAEVVALLTRIAGTLTDHALKSTDAAEGRLRIQLARQALALANQPRYVPGDRRDWQLLEQLAERLTVQEYQFDRTDALERAAVAMQDALAAHDLPAAFAAREKLVETYPDQARSRRWLELGRAAAGEARRQVQAVAEGRGATTGEFATAVTATLVLSDAVARPPGGAEPLPVFARSQGALYALDATNGQILWRRFTAADDERPPLAIDGGADVLVTDARDQSLLRVAAASGKLRWRQVVGAPLLDPLVVGDRVLLATSKGLVLSLQASTGEVVSQVQLPQELHVALAADPAGKAVYALAAHSNLYALATADLSCLGVTYLGHDAGSVEVGPAVLPKHLMIAENRGAADGVLRVFARGADGAVGQLVQELAIAGRVVTPPVSDGKRLAVATAERPVAICDVLDRGEAVLKKIGDLPASPGARLSSYLTLGAGRLWVADAGVRVFAMAALANRPHPVWQHFAGDVSLQSVQVLGERAIFVRRTPGQPGIVAACLDANSGEPQWETRLSVPAVAPCAVADDVGKVLVARRDGMIYRADIAAARGLIYCQAVANLASGAGEPSAGAAPVQAANLSVSSLVPLGARQGLALGTTAAATAIHMKTGKLRSYPLPGQLLCSSVVPGGGVFAVCQPGEIYFLSGRSESPDVQPFMPVVRPADKPTWHLAAAEGNAQPLVVVARGRQLYCLTVQAEPAAHLGALGMAELPAGFDGAPAAAGDLACAVDRSGAVQAFVLPELKSGPAWKLGSAPVWGPQAVGTVILVATADGQLHAIDSHERQVRWKTRLPQSDVVGAWAVDGKLLIACRDGGLSQFALEDGQQAGSAQLGEPLAAGPFAVGDSLVFVSAEGSLLKAGMP